MGELKNNKWAVKSVKRVEYGSYAQGTTFSKGDYIPTKTVFIVKLVGGILFEVGREAILGQFPGRSRVTDSLLGKMKGMDGRKLQGHN